MKKFEYHPEIITQFPGIQAGMIFGMNIVNRKSTQDLLVRYSVEQEAVLARIGETPLSELDSLAAWRSAFRQFGVNPTRYRSAVEALLRRLTKKGDIPSINALVDIGNLVSIRYQVPVAVFDSVRTKGAIMVKFAEGDEQFTPLFENDVEHPEPGEVIFLDGNSLVAARRWCWRQSDQSASRLDTHSVLIVTEAHHRAADQSMRNAVEDLKALMREYLGGEFVSGIVNSESPEFLA